MLFRSPSNVHAGWDMANQFSLIKAPSKHNLIWNDLNNCFREGTLGALVEHDKEALEDIEKLERFLMIAIWCIQEAPSLRPTMGKVTQMLGGVVDVPVPPCPFPFTTTMNL